MPDYFQFRLLFDHFDGQAKNLVKNYRNYPGDLLDVQ